MRLLLRLCFAVTQLAAALLITIVLALALALTDGLFRIFGRRRRRSDRRPNHSAASIVIPNWNGRHLLEKYLFGVVAAARRCPGSEVIVVDNGSTDGSADWIEAHAPEVRVVRLRTNLGFGGGCNVGVRAARNDIVVLLNSDMRVEPDFLEPLLAGFDDPSVFAVSCQIFFSDPTRRREETGLTEFRWSHGHLLVRHRVDETVNRLFPCAYPGGGSCAIDRSKFLELGGFDPLFHPFYLEDTDLGYQAWKRGWKVLYEPRSRVYHEHRGTIGRVFDERRIQTILRKNLLLFAWKNLHDWPLLVQHLLTIPCAVFVSALTGPTVQRPDFSALLLAARQLPQALSSRWRALSLSTVSDAEAIHRTRPGYYWDRFGKPARSSTRLRVLFVSPYPIYPPTHGGAVFMSEACHQLAKQTDLHVIVGLESPEQAAAHKPLEAIARTVQYWVRQPLTQSAPASLLPRAVREFADEQLDWLIQRTLFLERIDVLQLEYLQLAQYAGRFDRVVTALFEHDIYFQSVARQLPYLLGLGAKLRGALEYMRALRYELRMLPRFDLIQVCSSSNAQLLCEFCPKLGPRLDAQSRAGIAVPSYAYVESDRDRDTLLFVGSYRHAPNIQGLVWFIEHVFPSIRERHSGVRLIVVGATAPPAEWAHLDWKAVEFRGVVPDIRAYLHRCGLFICPIVSGSGIRVKVLEAFACGIPVVSTSLGVEGIPTRDGELCALADTPAEFARKTIGLLKRPEEATLMARRARAYVEQCHDSGPLIAKLVARYRCLMESKQAGIGAATQLPQPSSPVAASDPPES